MKMRLLYLLALVFTAASCFSQEMSNEVIKGKFRKENIFIGGSIGIGGGSGSFSVGANPEIGYSIAPWLDAGLAFNINYLTQTYTDFNGFSTRYNNFDYGTGIFVRAWPVHFLFIQVQPEINALHQSQSAVNYNAAGASATYTSQSVLAGVGYGGRLIGSHYSYLTLMIDLLNQANSPYRDPYNNPIPVFRAGFGFYLHPSRK